MGAWVSLHITKHECAFFIIPRHNGCMEVCVRYSMGSYGTLLVSVTHEQTTQRGSLAGQMNQLARISMLRRFSFVVGIIHESTAAGHYFVHENLHTVLLLLR
jgi:hypothetical protein